MTPFMWHPDYDKPLGPPMGPAKYEAGVWTPLEQKLHTMQQAIRAQLNGLNKNNKIVEEHSADYLHSYIVLASIPQLTRCLNPILLCFTFYSL